MLLTIEVVTRLSVQCDTPLVSTLDRVTKFDPTKYDMYPTISPIPTASLSNLPQELYRARRVSDIIEVSHSVYSSPTEFA